MKKATTLFLLLFVSFIIVGQIIIPINKTRTESYGTWYYNTLTIDSIRTQLDGSFISTGNSSIWGTYSEKLKIDSSYYECVYENLPIEPYEKIFHKGDTLKYVEQFMPIMEMVNSNRQLEFIGSDTVDFKADLPVISQNYDESNLQRHLFEEAERNLKNEELIAAARQLRCAVEIEFPFDTTFVINLASAIYSKSQSLRLSSKRIISEDLYHTVIKCHNNYVIDDWGYYDLYLSTLIQLDTIDNQTAKEISTKLIESFKTTKFDPDSTYVLLLRYRAISLFNLGNVQNSLNDFQDALKLQEKIAGITPLWFTLNSDISNCYIHQAKYKECLRVDLEILEHSNLLPSESLKFVYRDLCYDYINLEDYDNFISYANKTLSFPDLSDDLKYELYHALGNIYWQEKYDMASAEKYFDLWADLSLNLTSIPDSFKDYIDKRETLTSFYINNRNYPKALSNGYYNISEISKILGEECWEYAQSINNMANALAGCGEKEEALNLSQKSFDLRVKLHQQDSLIVPISSLVRSSINLSDFYRDMGDYDNAKKYVNFAIHNTDSIEDLRVQALLKSAYINFETNNNDSGFDDFFEAVEVLTHLKNIYGEAKYYNDELNTLAIMASFAFEYGEYRDVIKYYNSYRKIILKFNLSKKYLFDYFIGIMRSYYFMGKTKSVIKTSEQLLKLTKNLISDAFIRLDGKQRHNLMHGLVPVINEICVYLSMIPNKNAGILLYDFILLRKGILLQAEVDFDEFISASNNDDLIKLRDVYTSNNTLINSPNSSIDVDSLRLENERIEHDLLRIAKSIGDFTNGMLISSKEVKSKLSDGDVAIEFLKIEYKTDFDRNEIKYYAILLSPLLKYPQVIELNIDQEDMEDIQELDGEILYKKVWEPIVPFLKRTQNIYLSCDGVLHNIGIEYFSDGTGKLMADLYNIFRLSSTRQIIKDKVPNTELSMCLYGGLDYDSATQDYDRNVEDLMFTHKANELRDFRELRYGVNYLPNTLTEIKNIENIIKTKPNYKLLIYQGSIGTEESVKEIDFNSLRILHFATHGFYWDKETANKRKHITFISNMNTVDNIDEPLNRSGIFMSGVNASLRGESTTFNGEDGVLTGKEISLLNLKNIDLVVLSACQTGLGDTSDEGVLGLQRGFKLAGANTLLMSLWKVDDDATQILMTEFYKNYLGGISKRESLLNAQKVVRNTPGFEDPEYWAAFILLDALN